MMEDCSACRRTNPTAHKYHNQALADEYHNPFMTPIEAVLVFLVLVFFVLVIVSWT